MVACLLLKLRPIRNPRAQYLGTKTQGEVMHRKLGHGRVEHTRVLELCPVKRLGTGRPLRLTHLHPWVVC